jgi:trigger factor
MKVTVDEVSTVARQLNVELDWNEVESQYANTFQNLRKRLSVDGFRPGKVSPDVARRILGPRLKYEFTNSVIETTVPDVLKEQGIEAALDMSIKDTNYIENKFFNYVIVVEMDPEIKLPDYKKGFQVNKNTYIIDKEDVELYLQDLREHHAEIREVTAGAEPGHFIIADLQETDELGTPLIGKKIQDRLIKVGEGIFGQPGCDSLVGIHSGENARIYLASPKGEKSHYQVNVKRVEAHNLPELNEDFIRQHFEGTENLEALKKKVEESLQAEWNNRAEKEFLRAVSDYLIEKTSFEIPPSRLNRFLDSIVQDVTSRNNGKEQDTERIREQYRPIAEREIRWYLIQEKISKVEHIDVPKDELEARINQIVGQYAENNRDSVTRFYRKRENRDRLGNDLLEQKVFDHLRTFAKEKKVSIHTSDFRKRNLE